MNQLIEIAQIANTFPEGRIILSDALYIKSSPHRHIFTAYVGWSGADGVYVLDGEGKWHGPLHEKQANAGLMISSLYQRLKAIQLDHSGVVAANDQYVNAIIVE